MSSKIDYQQVSLNSVSGLDTDGNPFVEECYIIPLIIPLSEVASLLSGYDETDASSPNIETSRSLARLVLAALEAKVDEG
jgi:hypothetical protein|tara:strand:+ start:1692 stop:1931 length:240 start_codon:yes stop_codon:yes gene_type:complete